MTITTKQLEEWKDSVDDDNLFQIAREAMPALIEEVRRLRAEQYWDLIEQMREAWGDNYNVTRCEVEAFLDSRACHRPTKNLRVQRDEARAEVERLREALSRDVSDATHALIRVDCRCNAWKACQAIRDRGRGRTKGGGQ